MNLEELAIKFGSDKYYSHSYVPFYEQLFKGRTVKRLLEIGIGHYDLMKDFTPNYVPGSSLKMWQEYFQDADIFGCDIREDTLINEGRIRSMVCDQSSVDSLVNLATAFGPSYDVVVDDGSHRFEDQLLTIKILLPSQSSPHVWIIEDVQEPERLQQAIGAAVIGPQITIHRFNKRPDDTLIVIEP